MLIAGMLVLLPSVAIAAADAASACGEPGALAHALGLDDGDDVKVHATSTADADGTCRVDLLVARPAPAERGRCVVSGRVHYVVAEAAGARDTGSSPIIGVGAAGSAHDCASRVFPDDFTIASAMVKPAESARVLDAAQPERLEALLGASSLRTSVLSDKRPVQLIRAPGEWLVVWCNSTAECVGIGVTLDATGNLESASISKMLH